MKLVARSTVPSHPGYMHVGYLATVSMVGSHWTLLSLILLAAGAISAITFLASLRVRSRAPEKAERRTQDGTKEPEAGALPRIGNAHVRIFAHWHSFFIPPAMIVASLLLLWLSTKIGKDNVVVAVALVSVPAFLIGVIATVIEIFVISFRWFSGEYSRQQGMTSPRRKRMRVVLPLSLLVVGTIIMIVSPIRYDYTGRWHGGRMIANGVAEEMKKYAMEHDGQYPVLVNAHARELQALGLDVYRVPHFVDSDLSVTSTATTFAITMTSKFDDWRLTLDEKGHMSGKGAQTMRDDSGWSFPAPWQD